MAVPTYPPPPMTRNASNASQRYRSLSTPFWNEITAVFGPTIGLICSIAAAVSHSFTATSTKSAEPIEDGSLVACTSGGEAAQAPRWSGPETAWRRGGRLAPRNGHQRRLWQAWRRNSRRHHRTPSSQFSRTSPRFHQDDLRIKDKRNKVRPELG